MFVCAFLLQLAAGVTAWAGTDFFVINPGSEQAGIPATASAAVFGGLKDGTYPVAGMDKPLWADVIGGRVHVAAPVKAGASVKLGVDGKAAADAPLLAVAAEAGKPVEVLTDAGVFRVGGGFLEIRSKEKSVRIAIGDFQPEVVFKGANLVVLGGGGKAGSIRIYRSGLAQLTGFASLEFRSDEPMETIQARDADYGVSKPGGGQPLVFPGDWWRIFGKAKTLGVGVFPDYGTSALGKDAVIALSGGNQSAWLAPVETDKEAWKVRIQTQPPILALRDGKGAFASEVDLGGNSAKLAIEDRNGNGVPDMEGDLWLWSDAKTGGPTLALAFSKSPAADTGNRLCIFKTAGKDLAKIAFDESPVDTSKAAPEGKAFLKPELIVEDWNKDGMFLRGSVVFGGFLAGDRYSKDGGAKWSKAWDLNGDGVCDVFESSPGHYIFNLRQDVVSLLGLVVDPFKATVAVAPGKGYKMQEIASMFSKSTDPAGRTFKGAHQAFEEHFFVDIPANENPKIWKNGANFFYYIIGGGDVNRMTMGRLDGNKALRSWNIELDPVPAQDDANWNVVTFKDPAGHELKLNTISVPDGWNGKKAEIRDYLKGWYDMAEGKFQTKALHACFSPQGSGGVSSEGMYGGSLTTDERIEVQENGGSYTLYYSPLMGALHLKDADFGAYAIPTKTPDFWMDINRYYHREAHVGPRRFVGAQPAVMWRQREAKRLIGPVFLGYSDEDGDGYFDTYIYDIDNDGLYDRVLRYDDKAGVMTLTDRNSTASWPQKLTFEDVKYLPEKYDEISALYQKGIGQAPLVASLSLGSSGIPVNLVTKPFYKEVIPPFFDTFGPEWQTVVATDTYHCGELDGWLDFGPGGVSRIGSMFAKRGIIQKSVDSKWTAESLRGIDVLLLPSLKLTPSKEEIAALKKWIEAGGVAIVSTDEDKSAWTRLAALGKEFGFSLSEEFLSKRTPINMWKGLGGVGLQAKASETRTPAPWNEVKHFEDPTNAGLLTGFDYLSFTGYPLENLSNGLKPFLGYDGKTLMAAAAIGKGKLLVSGADLWTNRYIWHHEFYEGGAKNDQLVDRIVGTLAAALPVVKVSETTYTPEKITIKVAGKGGPMKFSRRYDALSSDLACIGNKTELAKKKFELSGVSVNGKPAAYTEVGTLENVELPAGESTVEISYQEIK